ncbi:hypothetical protein [Massilia consociata]|uniref:hypothetical protein n=1 Tax=Massilia consociata TaxID=760117 RepID=UPI0036D2C2F3
MMTKLNGERAASPVRNGIATTKYGNANDTAVYSPPLLPMLHRNVRPFPVFQSFDM